MALCAVGLLVMNSHYELNIVYYSFINMYVPQMEVAYIYSTMTFLVLLLVSSRWGMLCQSRLEGIQHWCRSTLLGGIVVMDSCWKSRFRSLRNVMRSIYNCFQALLSGPSSNPGRYLQKVPTTGTIELAALASKSVDVLHFFKSIYRKRLIFNICIHAFIIYLILKYAVRISTEKYKQPYTLYYRLEEIHELHFLHNFFGSVQHGNSI